MATYLLTSLYFRMVASSSFRIDYSCPFTGEAGAIMAKALARAQALEILGKAIGREHGSKVGIGDTEFLHIDYYPTKNLSLNIAL